VIEKKLQDKVDTVVADAVETEALDTNPAINPQVEESLKQTEVAPEPPQPSVLDSNEPTADSEPVEVAGLGNLVRHTCLNSRTPTKSCLSKHAAARSHLIACLRWRKSAA